MTIYFASLRLCVKFGSQSREDAKIIKDHICEKHSTTNLFCGMVLVTDSPGIIAMLLILFKIKMSVFVVFDKSKYDIPIIGEIITVTSDIHTMSYIDEYLFKGVEYTVYDVVEQDDDWIIFVCNEQINKLYGYRISYMQHKKYFTTKSDIRNKKLDKLLK